MNRSLEVLKSIYKPYRYTIKGKATILNTTNGDFIIKPKKKDLVSLYNYLDSRGFDNYPKLIDASRREVNVFEYVEDTKTPNPQKVMDLVVVLASLGNKTSYFKEVSEDTYKEIYENILGNINYYKAYYNSLYEKGFNEVYMSPSLYTFMRNYYKLATSLDFSLQELDSWYEIVKGESKIRVTVVHNNLGVEHFFKASKDVLISWDDYMIDTPIVDLVNLYKKECLNVDFSSILERYLNIFPLTDYEKKLFFVLITIPPEVNFDCTEFENCKNVSKLLDYVFKTEELIRPYYTKHEEEK